MSPPANIFSGLKVVDLASYIAGPASTTILSDFGADVIKVEPPRIGDPYRYFSRTPPNPVCKFNYAWQLTNRNKRSIAIDLKAPEARAVLERLVQQADVVVVNYPPKVKAALGLTYEVLSALNPRLIYADITGYGALGAEADKPGFDITAYWARTGLMQVTHDAGSPPTLPIPGIGDHATAVSLYAAIVTALYAREKTGRGDHVYTSLIAEGAWAAATWIEGGLHGAKFFPQHNRASPPNALLNPYATQDGRWLLLVAAQEKDWLGFTQAIGLAGLQSDPRFQGEHKRAENAADLVGILDSVFAEQPLDFWRDALDRGRVIYGVVQVAEEIVNDPQMIANEVFVPLKEPLGDVTLTVNSPMTVSSFRKVVPGRAPELSEHAAEILQELGFSQEELVVLLDQGTVGRASPASAAL
jgi:crotonobetainyl-CoA:carnitine CoA-transferase CaiB-like acyl-CoA transferase